MKETIVTVVVVIVMAFLSWLTVHKAVQVMEWQCEDGIRTDQTFPIPCH